MKPEKEIIELARSVSDTKLIELLNERAEKFGKEGFPYFRKLFLLAAYRVDSLSSFKRVVDEALNSGDGAYRP